MGRDGKRPVFASTQVDSWNSIIVTVPGTPDITYTTVAGRAVCTAIRGLPKIVPRSKKHTRSFRRTYTSLQEHLRMESCKAKYLEMYPARDFLIF